MILQVCYLCHRGLEYLGVIRYTDVTGMILQVKDNRKAYRSFEHLPLPHLARRKDSELDVPRRLGHLATENLLIVKKACSKTKSENLNFYLNVFFSRFLFLGLHLKLFFLDVLI